MIIGPYLTSFAAAPVVVGHFNFKATIFTYIGILSRLRSSSLGSATVSKTRRRQRCSRPSPHSESTLKLSQSAPLIETEFDIGAISASWEIIFYVVWYYSVLVYHSVFSLFLSLSVSPSLSS